MPGSGPLRSLKKARAPAEPPQADVLSLDSEGRGVARIAGKVVFIDGALPGERVEVQIWRRQPRFDRANSMRVLRESCLRVQPRCPHYERCGGCSLQHLESRAQVAAKQRILEDNLLRIGKLEARMLLSPVHGAAWGYRCRARMSIRVVPRKGGALVGFHERRTHLVVDMDSCDVLPPQASALIAPLRGLISRLELAARIPQVELAAGEAKIALCLRVLDPLPDGDKRLLQTFGAIHGVDVYVQPRGPGSEYPLDPASVAPLTYRLPDFNLCLAFRPTDFTQVSHEVNRVLVRRAIALLGPSPGKRVLDLFCGLGNFTLPIARSGAHAVGVEGNPELVRQGEENARRNGLSGQVEFICADLARNPAELMARLGPFDQALIDPPREGASELVGALPETLRRVVYVSCNPATLARDAARLVHERGFALEAAGVVNMFPHTSHVESIALFTRE